MTADTIGDSSDESPGHAYVRALSVDAGATKGLAGAVNNSREARVAVEWNADV